MRAGVANLCGRFQCKQHERVESISKRESHIRPRATDKKIDSYRIWTAARGIYSIA